MNNENEKRPPMIIFCLPGNNFSGLFLESFSCLLNYCHLAGIKYFISRKECSVVYYVRNMCLGGDLRRGVDQKPFDGKFDYTHLMWIDSDMVFKPAQFKALFEHDKDIVSGVYKMGDASHYTVVENMDMDYLKQNGTFQFLVDEDLKNKKRLFKAFYTGFGFILIKRGVFESLNYPWFEPLFIKHENIVEFCSEDLSFCKKAKDKGFDIWIDPVVRVGHEKRAIV
jgi:hypothetical protein